MPLSFAVPDNGQVGFALRRQRGVHNTLGTGACRRLASLLPIEVSVSPDADAAALPLDLVIYLSYAMLRIEQGVRLELLIKYMVGIERMGAAIDKGLEHIRGDAPRSASVLRAELRRIATRLVADGDGAAFMVAPADLYEVQFTAYPVIAAPEAEGEEEAPEDPHDSTMDWLSELCPPALVLVRGCLVHPPFVSLV